MLDRKIAPTYVTIDKVEVMQVEKNQLSNGIPFFSLSAGSQEITKLEFIFKAGMYQQQETLVASATNSMMELGTKSFTANELSDGIDFFGSFLEMSVEQDFAYVTIYSLNKHLENTLKYLEEILKYPVFLEHEFETYIANKKQKHFINSQKVSVLARRKFVELLYGEQHPYGKNVLESDFDRLKIQDLQNFFNQNYNASQCTIIASGKLPENIISVLETFFGKNVWSSTLNTLEQKQHLITTTKTNKTFIQREDAVQSAIRIGRVLFNKTHPDYFKFQILNTVLGGYFGSRLMANIREDKGYTYGIGSGLTNLVNSGYFFISTEVGSDVTQPAIDEIYLELKKLRENLINTSELDTVRNYVLGHFLRSVDGPFSLASKFKSIWEYGLDYSFYDNYFYAVKTVNPAELRDLANQYFQEKDFIECVAGKK
jgi:predicted Zn-dependent peptidase